MKLNNCPFCGCDVVSIQYIPTNAPETSRCIVKCEVCGAQTRLFTYNTADNVTRQRAAFVATSAWNNRAEV